MSAIRWSKRNSTDSCPTLRGRSATRNRSPRGTVARYRAKQHEIAARYAEWEIIGPPEIRDVDPDARYFSPHASFNSMMNAEIRRYTETAPELQPALDALESFLVGVFLRRYVVD